MPEPHPRAGSEDASASTGAGEPVSDSAPAVVSRRTAATEEPFVRPPTPRSREQLRRRRLIATAGAAVIVVAVAVLTFVLLNREAPDPVVLEPIPGETFTAPVPTPALEPVGRDTSTAFLGSLPDTVLQWSLSAQQVPLEDLLAAGALEAASLTYTDGEQEVALVTAQWRSPEAAAAAIAALGIEGEPVRSEEVLVGGSAVGTMALYGHGAQDRVVWTNGATSFAVVAPPDAGENFYDAFGM